MLSTQPDPPPLQTVWIHTLVLIHTGKGGREGRWTSENVRLEGQQFTKPVENTQHDWLYLQSINSKTIVKTTFRVWSLYSYLVHGYNPMQNLAKIDYMTELETNCAMSLAPDRLSELGARICKRFRSPGIDSKELILPTYVACRAGTRTLFVLPE